MTKEHERFLRWFEGTGHKLEAFLLRQHWERGEQYIVKANLRNKREIFNRLNESMKVHQM